MRRLYLKESEGIKNKNKKKLMKTTYRMSDSIVISLKILLKVLYFNHNYLILISAPLGYSPSYSNVLSLLTNAFT